MATSTIEWTDILSPMRTLRDTSTWQTVLADSKFSQIRS